MYTIHSKSDFQTGAVLTVRIAEADVDKKALYTILADRPEFVLPFRHRSIDGQIEFTYQVGNRSKLAYLSGSRSPGEYADLWLGILQPLLDCGNWFLTPFSFVLKPEYLYCDKNGKLISFIYIPSMQACSDCATLKSMVTDVARQNHVTDINLENKVVWAIQDFEPNEFLKIVKPYKTGTSQENTLQQAATAATVQAVAAQPRHTAQPSATPPVQRTAVRPVKEPLPVVAASPTDRQKKSDDMVINLPAGGKALKPDTPKSGLFGGKKEKAEKVKATKAPKDKSGIFNKKKVPQVIMQGAAAMLNQPEPMQTPPVLTPIAEPYDDVTQLEVQETGACKFRYIGNGEHPRFIEVDMAAGGIFTIGRYDSSLGTQQSSFEFDKKTKAVSRRHAAIELGTEGHMLVDLDSAAGTFINGTKLPPNTPVRLEHGFRVSFGHSGADYIWENYS